MHDTQIVKKPLVTEKSTWEGERHGRYSFRVDPRATKPQVKRAIEALYEVRVEKVRTLRRKPKQVRNRFGRGKTASWKKAIVELHPDDRIDLI